MKHILRNSPSLIVVIAIAACAPLTDPSTLTKVPSYQAIKLESELIYPWSVENPQIFSGLISGNYVAELEDAEGVFYRGPSGCYMQRNKENVKLGFNSDGGLWVAKKSGASKYKIYYYLGTDQPMRDSSMQRSDAYIDNVRQTMTDAKAGRDGISTVADAARISLAAGLVSGILAAGLENERGKIIFAHRPPQESEVERAMNR